MSCKASEADPESRTSTAAGAQIAELAANLLRGQAYPDKMTFTLTPEGNNQVLISGGGAPEQKFSVSGQSCKNLLSLSPRASGEGRIETSTATYSGTAPEFTIAGALKDGVKAGGAMKSPEGKVIFNADVHCGLAGNSVTGVLSGELKASCDAKLTQGDGKPGPALNFKVSATGGNKDIVVSRDGKELLVAKYIKGLNNGPGTLEISITQAGKAN